MPNCSTSLSTLRQSVANLAQFRRQASCVQTASVSHCQLEQRFAIAFHCSPLMLSAIKPVVAFSFDPLAPYDHLMILILPL